MIIVKKPEFENDDYLLRLDFSKLPKAEKALSALKDIDRLLAEYYWTKRQAFLTQNTDPNIFARFVDDKPSLRSLSELETLDSTIYTVACERENNSSYHNIINDVKMHVTQRPNTRRCVLRFMNGFDKYFKSEIETQTDVTCLSFIHYLNVGPKLVFRASDVKNELLVDILTINEFFIDPVYINFKEAKTSIYSSTTQGFSSWDNFVELFRRLMCLGENE